MIQGFPSVMIGDEFAKYDNPEYMRPWFDFKSV